MVAALKKLNANVTYIEVPGGSHTDVVVPNLPKAFDFMAAQKKVMLRPAPNSSVRSLTVSHARRSSLKPVARRRLRRDARITVLTGAGVSAASGVPTFRGSDGLWKNFRPEALATAEAFGRDPNLVWEWYAWRRSRIAACDPNQAHRVLADWGRRFPNFTLITQNVDGLHERVRLRMATAGQGRCRPTSFACTDRSGR